MPATIGQGRLKRVARTSASNWVLSPTSANATTAVEVMNASIETSAAGHLQANSTRPPARLARKRGAIGLARAGSPLPSHHGLSAKHVDAKARPFRTAGYSPVTRLH